MKKLKKFSNLLKIAIVAIISILIIVTVIGKTNLSVSLKELTNISILSDDFNKNDEQIREENKALNTDVSPLSYSGKKQLVLEPLDDLGRAVGSHIQLKSSHLPTEKRESRLNYNPVGWHNYKIDGYWLMNRGHLVGYQFSGLNDEARNLVPETAYLNQGSISGMDDNNTKSMLYYENRLAKWLKSNSNYWLDYDVRPIYEGQNLIPTQILLTYQGFDSKGKPIKVSVGGNETFNNSQTKVLLENRSPNAQINYSDGTLKK